MRAALQTDRSPAIDGLDRRQEGRLAGGATPALAAALATQVGVVQLDPALERFGRLAREHHLHDLLLHRPGVALLDPEPAAEFDRADPVLGRDHEMDGQEPGGQGQLGGVEDRPGGERDLALAAVALVELAPGQPRVATVVAGRADEPLRPAKLLQRRPAWLFRPERRAELSLAQSFGSRRQPCRHCRASLNRQTHADPSLVRMSLKADQENY